MVNATQMKPKAPVVCSNNGHFAVVDHAEGVDFIKVHIDGPEIRRCASGRRTPTGAKA